MSQSHPVAAPTAVAARPVVPWWRPGRWTSWLATVLAALTMAALGAASGDWLGWRDAGDLPTDAQARALAAAVAPGSAVQHIERFDALFGYEYNEPQSPIIGSDDYRAGYVAVSLALPQDGFAALVDRVQKELLRQGWRLGPNPSGDGLTAVRGDLVLSTYPVEECGQQEPEACGMQDYVLPYGGLGIQLERANPPAVAPLTVAGWFAGLVLGWLAARWIAARLRRRPGSAVAVAIGWFGLCALLPATVFTNVGAVGTVVGPDTFAGAVWSPYMFIFVRLPAMLGTFCLLSVVAIAVLIRPSENPVSDPPYPLIP